MSRNKTTENFVVTGEIQNATTVDCNSKKTNFETDRVLTE